MLMLLVDLLNHKGKCNHDPKSQGPFITLVKKNDNLKVSLNITIYLLDLTKRDLTETIYKKKCCLIKVVVRPTNKSVTCKQNQPNALAFK